MEAAQMLRMPQGAEEPEVGNSFPAAQLAEPAMQYNFIPGSCQPPGRGFETLGRSHTGCGCFWETR
jgi:hypothetical protein